MFKKWQKVVEQNSEYTLFSKVLGENEKCVFYFYFKTKGTFWPTHWMTATKREQRKNFLLEGMEVQFGKGSHRVK